MHAVEGTPEDKIIDRIQKLFNKANGTSNEFEKVAFLEKAEALIEQYKLDWARIATQQNLDGHGFGIDVAVVQMAESVYVPRFWKISVASGICEYYGLKLVISGRLFFKFIGPKDLLDVAVTHYHTICAQITVECAARYEQARKIGLIGRGYGKTNGKKWHTACLDKAGEVVSGRLKLKKRQEMADVVTMAIVPVIEEAIEEFMQETFGKMHSFQSHQNGYEASAAAAGRSVGNAVAIDKELKS